MTQITETYANGITRTYTPIACANCASLTDPLAIFPNNLCLECYKGTKDAHRPITARELAQMWGAN
jgi:hypothetical protein